MNKIRSSSYIKIVESARKQGQEEAWELVRRIACIGEDYFQSEEIKEIFDTYDSDTALKKYTYAEAAAKVAEWEERKKKFRVGDVVKHDGYRIRGVVVGVNENTVKVIRQDGCGTSWDFERITKTGRTLPVEDWLRQIGGAQECQEKTQ